MKLANVLDGVLIGVAKNEYVNKEGKLACFYNLSVKQGGAVATVPCSKDIYDMYVAKQIEDFLPYRFDCTYDDRFGRFEILGAHAKK